MRNARDDLAARSIDGDGHEFLVAANVKQFLAIGAPARLRAASIGDLDARACSRELRHKNVRIYVAARSDSRESHPLAVGRELSFGAAGIGRVRMFPEIVEFELRWPVLKIHVDEIMLVWRPVVNEQPDAFRQGLRFARTICGRRIDVRRTFAISA